MEGLRITHVGGPTVLIERAGWALLTDPTFDPAGGAYRFGWGTGSRKTAGPAVAAAALPPLDAVLLTHDHHGDNLDRAGRALLPSAGTVVTTASGARRLGDGARGLAPWAALRLEAPGRHGPLRRRAGGGGPGRGGRRAGPPRGARFPVTGPLRFTMTGAEAAELIGLVRPRVAVPVHDEGWAHFPQGREAAARQLAQAPEDVRRRVRWIPVGTPVDDL